MRHPGRRCRSLSLRGDRGDRDKEESIPASKTTRRRIAPVLSDCVTSRYNRDDEESTEDVDIDTSTGAEDTCTAAPTSCSEAPPTRPALEIRR